MYIRMWHIHISSDIHKITILEDLFEVNTFVVSSELVQNCCRGARQLKVTFRFINWFVRISKYLK